jgi:sporulation protein YlmC with PRC-barrel domain
MLHRVTQLKGRPVVARDGEVGSVRDVYFDDERWGVRYLVVRTGGWLDGREVLVSPHSVRRDAGAEAVHLDLTREQVENSPPVEADRPVSRRYEMAHGAYYHYPPYWEGPYLWGIGPYPEAPPGEVFESHPQHTDPSVQQTAEAELEAAAQSHLRSSNDVLGYTVQASDGAVGRLEDIVVDDEAWGIRDLVVDTRRWLPGGQVAVPHDAVASIDWSESRVRLSMDREAVKHAPAVH